MEDSSEVHSDGNRVSPEKNSKRILKTPAQLDALEKFYNEHKYPTEELKSQMAEKIGLTEKQISSWFCHRRLKDKKLRDETHANGRQDQASGIMQDCGSGLWQDSCGSIKQGDQRYTDEVNGMDNTSSEGSLSLQEKFYSPMRGPSGKEISGHLPQTSWSAKAMVHKPSGYLKVRGEIENAAITAVKRQLGRHYREDGPLLSVEFEPIPPGAFELQRRDIVNGSFYDKGLIQNQCPDTSGIRNESRIKNRHDRHTPKMSSQDSYLVETTSRLDHGPGYPGWKSHHHLKLNSNIHKHSYPDEDTVGNKNDVPAEQTLRYNNKRNYKINSKHSVEEDSIFEHQSLDHRTFSNRRMKPALYDDEHDVPESKVPQSTDYAFKPSSLFVASGPSFVRNERAPYTLNRKENSTSIEMETEEHHEPARSKVRQTSEFISENKSRVELPQDDYLTRSSLPNMFHRKTSRKRFSMGRQASFSEVETMETSSSIE